MWYTFGMKTLFFLSFVIAGFAPIFAGGVDSLFGVKFGVPYEGSVGALDESAYFDYATPDVACIRRSFDPRIKILGFDSYEYELTPRSMVCYLVGAKKRCPSESKAFLFAMQVLFAMVSRLDLDLAKSDVMNVNNSSSITWSKTIFKRTGSLNALSADKMIDVTVVFGTWDVVLTVIDCDGLEKKEEERLLIRSKTKDMQRYADEYADAIKMYRQSLKNKK